MRGTLVAMCIGLLACRKDAAIAETSDAAKPPTQTVDAGTDTAGPTVDAGWTHGPHVEVLYRGSTDLGGVGLIGVAPDKKQAVVQGGTGICKTANDCGPAGHRFETIDWGAGKVIDRWQTDPMFDCPKEEPPPLANPFRYAKLVHDLGSPASAVTPGVKYRFTDDGKRVLFITCPTRRLFVAEADGSKPRHIGGARAPAIDRIAIAPDGRRIAWTMVGGVPMSPHGEGPSGPRQPGVVIVADLGTLAVKQLSAPDDELYQSVFTRDSKDVLFVADRPKETCLVAVAATMVDTMRTLHCAERFSGSDRIAMSPNGNLALLYGTSAFGSVRYVLFDLTAGKLRATRVRKMGDREDAIVSDSGIAVFNDNDTLVLFDLVGNRQAVLRASVGWYHGLKTTRWLPDGRLIAINYGYPTVGYQLVAIDVAAALAAK